MNQTPPMSQLPALSPGGESDSIRVLHVDDDPDFSDLTSTFLEREGDAFTVETATSASEGLDRLEEEEIDCIVSDYDMPGTNGLDFLEQVREEYADLPFVLFTGKGSEEIASEAISRGVTEYTQKGRGTDQYTVLANRIRNAVQQYRAERTAERTQQYFDLLVEETANIIFLVGPDGTVKYVTPSAESVLGRTPEELVGTNAFDPIHPEDRERVIREYSRLGEDSEERRTVEFRYRHPDGSWVWIEAHGRNLLDHPIIEGMVVYPRDITERKEHERELAATARRLQAVVETSPLPIVAMDPDGTVQLWTPAAERMFGWSESEVVGEPIPTVPERYREEFRERRERVLDGESFTGVNVCRRTKAGEEIDLILSTAPIHDADEKVVGVMAVFDTAPKRERVLRALHGTTRRLMQADNRERIGEITVDAACDILDMPINALWLYNETENALEPVASTERSVDLVGELPIYAEDNSLSWEAFETGEIRTYADLSTEPERYDPDTPIRSELIIPLGDHGVMNIGSTEPDAFDELDVSLAQLLAANTETALERTTHQRRVQAERDRFQAVFAEAFDAMLIADGEGRYVNVNRSASELFGLPEGNLTGRSISDFAPREFDFEAAWDEFQSSEKERGTFPLVRADGDRRIVEYAATTDIVPGRHLSVLRDITEREERKRELQRQNERLEAFASTVSHDLRNPLNILQGSLQFAEETGDPEHFERCKRACDRMDRLIDEVLTLARSGEAVAELEPIDLDRLAAHAWETVDTGDATLRIETDRTIEGDESQLRQLLENLFRNAVEHGSEDGQTGPDDHGQTGSTVTIVVGDLDAGFYVEDDGSGIPDDQRDEVFEMGYSTEDDGTGFGLSIVEQIAESHGWEVTVTTGTDEGGARFEVTGVESG